MTPEAPRRPRAWPRFLGIGAVICVLLGVFFGTQIYLIVTRLQGHAIRWGRSLRWGLFVWCLWGVLALPIAVLARRFAFTRQRWPPALAVHALGALTFAMIHVTLGTSWFWLLEEPERTAATFR